MVRMTDGQKYSQRDKQKDRRTEIRKEGQTDGPGNDWLRALP